jgi:hypothetical protein
LSSVREHLSDFRDDAGAAGNDAFMKDWKLRHRSDQRPSLSPVDAADRRLLSAHPPGMRLSASAWVELDQGGRQRYKAYYSIRFKSK